MSFQIGQIITLSYECIGNDARDLCFFPFGQVEEIREDGSVMVRTMNHWRRDPHEPQSYQPDELTTFVIYRNNENNDPSGPYTLVDYDPQYDLMALQSPDGEVRHLHESYLTEDGVFYMAKNSDTMEKKNKYMESAKNIGTMKEVSKEGVMAHLPLPNNLKSKIMAGISGYNIGVPNEKIHELVLKERLSRSDRESGPGVNVRYGKPVAYRPPSGINLAVFNKGPLPHGPTEENFAGGKRNSRGKIGTKMARRGTRRSSRGIFSRLYAPIGHLLSAGKESVGAVTNTAKGVVGEGIHGLDKIGRSVTKHANMAVKDVFTRKGGKRKASGTRKSRKSRRNTRRRR